MPGCHCQWDSSLSQTVSGVLGGVAATREGRGIQAFPGLLGQKHPLIGQRWTLARASKGQSGRSHKWTIWDSSGGAAIVAQVTPARCVGAGFPQRDLLSCRAVLGPGVHFRGRRWGAEPAPWPVPRGVKAPLDLDIWFLERALQLHENTLPCGVRTAGSTESVWPLLCHPSGTWRHLSPHPDTPPWDPDTCHPAPPPCSLPCLSQQGARCGGPEGPGSGVRPLFSIFWVIHPAPFSSALSHV